MSSIRPFWDNRIVPKMFSFNQHLPSAISARLLANARRLAILFLALQATHAYSQTVDLVHLLRPWASGGDFYVGDTWRLDVYGGANQQVAISSVHNGGPLSGPLVLGTTNGSGFFSLTGSMSTYEIGTWTEWVTVGGLSASPTLVFDVLAAPTAPCDSSISSHPLLLFSYDYFDTYNYGQYSHSSFGQGKQKGNGGPQPFCAMVGGSWITSDAEHLELTNATSKSPYEIEVTWKDVGGRVFSYYPAYAAGSTLYVGVDIRNGYPFYKVGYTDLTVFQVYF